MGHVGGESGHRKERSDKEIRVRLGAALHRTGCDKFGAVIGSLRKNQSKYLNNNVEQDHRVAKRITRPMLGFKSFRCARILLAGIEVMHMIRKGQFGAIKDRASSAANQLYSLAF